MLLIPCPWCGPRPDSEFLCTGEARALVADAPGPGAGRSVVEAADAHTEQHTDMSADAGTEGATDNVTEATEDAATWADRLWHRDNPRGLVRERWWHAHGCRLWLTVERDTVTHEIRTGRGPQA